MSVKKPMWIFIIILALILIPLDILGITVSRVIINISIILLLVADSLIEYKTSKSTSEIAVAVAGILAFIYLLFSF